MSNGSKEGLQDLPSSKLEAGSKRITKNEKR